MYKDNKHHLQPVLICSVNELPEEQREYLNTSWAGVFYREFFCRLDEEPFAVCIPICHRGQIFQSMCWWDWNI
jgi:hypothetical protein